MESCRPGPRLKKRPGLKLRLKQQLRYRLELRLKIKPGLMPRHWTRQRGSWKPRLRQEQSWKENFNWRLKQELRSMKN
ncbi:hypothetical protein ES703_121683 [subsurface metagenome]